MKKFSIGLFFIFCLCSVSQETLAESVDVFVPTREVTMNSSNMAKNLDNAAKKVKESYSKDKNTQQTASEKKSGKNNKCKKNINNTHQRRYTSEWT